MASRSKMIAFEISWRTLHQDQCHRLNCIWKGSNRSKPETEAIWLFLFFCFYICFFVEATIRYTLSMISDLYSNYQRIKRILLGFYKRKKKQMIRTGNVGDLKISKKKHLHYIQIRGNHSNLQINLWNLKFIFKFRVKIMPINLASFFLLLIYYYFFFSHFIY